jgi:hypothetical protein
MATTRRGAANAVRDEQSSDDSRSHSSDSSLPARRGPKSKGRSESEQPIKATFYLTRDAAETLEDGWYNLRKLAPPALRASVTKSMIVRFAIELALEDFKSDTKSSRIAKKLLSELEVSSG